MQTTILTKTNTDNMSDALRAIYSDADLMLWWLARPATLRDKLARARQALATARAPQGKFGLDSVPADVITAITAFFVACKDVATPVLEHVAKARGAGLSWSEVWAFLPVEFDSLGFGPGDATILGIEV